MIIGAIEVITPQDKAYAYDMSWRHEIAKALKVFKDPNKFLADDWIFKQVQYLKALDDECIEACLDDSSEGMFYDTAIANKLYQSSSSDHSKERIEALLLCPELDYETIGKEMNVPPEAVCTFEKLFFNVRDSKGKLVASTGLLMYAALKGAVAFDGTARKDESYPGHWRIVAFEGGYKPLYAIWGWKFKSDKLPGFTPADFTIDMMRNAYRHIDKVLRFNERIDVKALAQILTTLSQQFADLRREGILSEDDKINVNNLAFDMLKLLAPERVIESDVERNLAQGELDAKLQSVMTMEAQSSKGSASSLKHIERQLNKGATDNV